MKKRTKIILIVLAVFMVLGAVGVGVLYKLYKDQNSFIMELKDNIKIFLCDIKIPKLGDETDGLSNAEIAEKHGGITVYKSGDILRLVNCVDGYYGDFPENTKFDVTFSTDFLKAEAADFSVTISREYATEDNVQAYIEWYLDRFLLDENWRTANRVQMLSEKENRGNYDIFSARLLEYDGGYDGYSYVNVYTGTKIYYRLTFKYDGDNYGSVSKKISDFMDGFTYFRPEKGSVPEPRADYLENHDLSDESRAVYKQISESGSVFWGIFTKDIYDEGINETIPKYESELDFDFSVILSYLHFGDAFPRDYAEKLYADGKIMELTYQVTTSNNENLADYTPQLDIYRGLYDGQLRAFAKAAAAFGRPFLFRLGNEMNSDWTSYSGVVNMADPEIYTAVWQRIYKIFIEEGANNAIWIYNPNDRAYPPCKWNSPLAYWPGAGYVHMIGVTGYNNGTYYKEQNNEVWRSFRDIYDRIEKEYSAIFGDYPWIITEFSSSSIGGNKAKWIEDMFKNIDRYENIKIAVWFDYADFDPAYPDGSVEARPYWLLENDEITAAVKNGFKTQIKTKWRFAA